MDRVMTMLQRLTGKKQNGAQISLPANAAALSTPDSLLPTSSPVPTQKDQTARSVTCGRLR
jgi:hypothetical protein